MQSVCFIPPQVGTLLNINDNNQKSGLTTWAYSHFILFFFFLLGMLEDGEVNNLCMFMFWENVSGGGGGQLHAQVEWSASTWCGFRL